MIERMNEKIANSNVENSRRRRQIAQIGNLEKVVK